MAFRPRKHRCDPFKEEIKEELAKGKTLNAICDYLSINHDIYIEHSELCVYIKNRGLRTQITRGYHNDKAPHCKGCKNYIEVKTNYIQDRNTNVRVCKALLEVIPQGTQTSPEFCPKRKGGD